MRPCHVPPLRRIAIDCVALHVLLFYSLIVRKNEVGQWQYFRGAVRLTDATNHRLLCKEGPNEAALEMVLGNWIARGLFTAAHLDPKLPVGAADAAAPSAPAVATRYQGAPEAVAPPKTTGTLASIMALLVQKAKDATPFVAAPSKPLSLRAGPSPEIASAMPPFPAHQPPSASVEPQPGMIPQPPVMIPPPGMMPQPPVIIPPPAMMVPPPGMMPQPPVMPQPLVMMQQPPAMMPPPAKAPPPGTAALPGPWAGGDPSALYATFESHAPRDQWALQNQGLKYQHDCHCGSLFLFSKWPLGDHLKVAPCIHLVSSMCALVVCARVIVGAVIGSPPQWPGDGIGPHGFPAQASDG